MTQPISILLCALGGEGSGVLPMQRADFEAAILDGHATGNASQQASLRGFALGLDAVQQQRTQSRYVDAVLAPVAEPTASAVDVPALPEGVAALFPVAVHPMLRLGHARLIDYQGANYAALYVQRLQAVWAAEQAGAPGQSHATEEVARWLALWMAFDDIVRVADLKSRASRLQRVRDEVKAKADDVVKLFDHFKPGVPEFAGLLPSALAEHLMAWEQRRVAGGKAPLGLPIKVGTHTVGGLLLLRLRARTSADHRVVGGCGTRRTRPPRLGAGTGAMRPPDQRLWQHPHARTRQPAAHLAPPGCNHALWQPASPRQCHRPSARSRLARRGWPGLGRGLACPRCASTRGARTTHPLDAPGAQRTRRQRLTGGNTRSQVRPERLQTSPHAALRLMRFGGFDFNCFSFLCETCPCHTHSHSPAPCSPPQPWL